jgi:hypothetical protein
VLAGTPPVQRPDADEVQSGPFCVARLRAAVIALSAFRMITLPRAGTPWEGKGAQRLGLFCAPFALSSCVSF